MKQAFILVLTAVAVVSLLGMGVSAHQEVRMKDREAMKERFAACVEEHGLDACKEKVSKRGEREKFQRCAEAHGEEACKERWAAHAKHQKRTKLSR